MKKNLENTFKIEEQINVLSPGTYLDRPGIVDLTRKSSIRVQKAQRNDSFRPFLIFKQILSKIGEDFGPFWYL